MHAFSPPPQTAGVVLVLNNPRQSRGVARESLNGGQLCGHLSPVTLFLGPDRTVCAVSVVVVVVVVGYSTEVELRSLLLRRNPSYEKFTVKQGRVVDTVWVE